MEWAESLDHLGSRVHATDFSLLHRVYRRDYAEVFERSAELVTFTSAHAHVGPPRQGADLPRLDHRDPGRPDGGPADLAGGIGAAAQRHRPRGLSGLYLPAGRSPMAAGSPEQAVDELRQALPEFERLGLHVWRSEVLRMLGEVTLAADPTAIERADTLFGEAARIADQQGAAMLRLRIAVSKARLDLRLDRRAGGCAAARRRRLRHRRGRSTDRPA